MVLSMIIYILSSMWSPCCNDMNSCELGVYYLVLKYYVIYLMSYKTRGY